ncbi:MAG: hypothetical protein PVJ72_16795, partial [Gammaproteobacteria bacterium]
MPDQQTPKPASTKIVDPHNENRDKLPVENNGRQLPAHKLQSLTPEMLKIVEARHHDPFAVLGKHSLQDEDIVRVFLPAAKEVFLVDIDAPMTRLPDTDVFVWQGPAESLPEHYRLEWYDRQNQQHIDYDPYCFPALIPDFDLHLFGQGKHWNIYRVLGAHWREVAGIRGMSFAVWAPNADRVSVVGDFNQWDGRAHTMRNRGGSGVW